LELSRESNCGEATAIIVKLDGASIFGASVGDSELWLFNKDYEYELTSMQILKPLLGSGRATPIGFGPMSIDQSVVLGSDGLFKYIKNKDLKSLISAKASATTVAELAKRDTGNLQDDISVICIRKEP